VQTPREGTCRYERPPVGRAGATSPRTFDRDVGDELGARGEVVERLLDERERAREVLWVLRRVRRLPKRARSVAKAPSDRPNDASSARCWPIASREVDGTIAELVKE
jgi:hypothetical protein